jgi:hypothetical protein
MYGCRCLPQVGCRELARAAHQRAEGADQAAINARQRKEHLIEKAAKG